MKNIVKKVSSILILLLTIGCLYAMSKGMVGIGLSYVLIGIHIIRLLIEAVAVRMIADKLTIREDIRIEIPRKVVHMLVCLITIPMIYYAFKGTIHSIIFSIIILAVIVICDKIGLAQKLATRDGGGSDNVASVYYLLTGYTINSLISLILPQYTTGVLLGATTLGLGDPAACIMGKLLGKHKFKNGKSVEGFIGFILGATISMFIFTHITIWKLVIISIAGAIAELISGDYDNLTIQLIVGLMVVIIL